MFFLKIWRFEFRRQRINSFFAFSIILIFTWIMFCQYFPQTWQEILSGIFTTCTVSGGIFMLIKGFSFQQRIFSIFATFPEKLWKALPGYFSKGFIIFMICALIVFSALSIYLMISFNWQEILIGIFATGIVSW